MLQNDIQSKNPTILVDPATHLLFVPYHVLPFPGYMFTMERSHLENKHSLYLTLPIGLNYLNELTDIPLSNAPHVAS